MYKKDMAKATRQKHVDIAPNAAGLEIHFLASTMKPAITFS